MSTRSVKARVELDGEKEYKAALQDLNSGNRTLASEMKKLQAEYKGNTESTEYLTKKGALLEQQLLQQRDKVQTLRDAVNKLATQYGESDSRTQEWIQKLNNAEAAEYDLEHAIQANDKALQGEQETMTGLGDAVGGLTEKLGIRLPQGATNALNGMSKLSAGTVAAMGVAVAGVMALVKAVQTLQDETVAAAARADDIMTKATQMNISTQQYQALQYASPFVDVDVDTMASSLQKLTAAMGDAAAGSETAIAKFSELGVSITNADGSLRDSYDVWLDTMDALAGMTNETERDVAAQELLGKSATDLATIYRDGTGTLREYTKAAEDNYIMSDEQLAALGAVDDAVQHLHMTQEANKNMIANEWAPTAKQAFEAFDRLVAAAGKALVDSGIIKGFGELVQFAVGLIDPITSLLEKADSAPGRLQPVYEILHGIAGVFAWIADVGQAAVGILQFVTGNFSGGYQNFSTAMGWNKSTGTYSHLQKWQGYGDTSGQYYDESIGAWTGNYGRNAPGNNSWRGGLTWVGEAGPELVDLSPGARVWSAQDSRNLGGDTIIVQCDINQLQDIEAVIRLAKSARVRQRMR